MQPKVRGTDVGQAVLAGPAREGKLNNPCNGDVEARPLDDRSCTRFLRRKKERRQHPGAHRKKMSHLNFYPADIRSLFFLDPRS